MVCYDPPMPTPKQIKEMEERNNKRMKDFEEQEYKANQISLKEALQERLNRVTAMLCALTRVVPEEKMTLEVQDWIRQHVRHDVERLMDDVIWKAINHNDINMLTRIRDALEPLESKEVRESTPD